MKIYVFLLALLPVFLYSAILYTGESTVINLEFNGKFRLSIEDVIGGIIPEDLLIDNFEFVNFATFTYIAPIVPTKSYIKLKVNDKVIFYKFDVIEPILPDNKAPAILKEFKGYVAVSKDGKNWESVFKEKKLYEGDILKTLDDSYAIIQGTWGNLFVKPNTTLKIIRSRTNNKNFDFIVEVENGEVIADVVKFLMTKSRFQIKKGSVTAGVRGTKFGCKHNEWYVFDGEIYLFNGNRLISLGAKKIIKIIENTFQTPEKFEQNFENYIQTFDEIFDILEKEIDKQMEEWEIELPGI